MFWENAWLHEKPLKDKFPILYGCCTDRGALVKDCWDGEAWDHNFRRSFGANEMRDWENLMLELDQVQLNGGEDLVRWRLEKSGSYSTKSMYMLLSCEGVLNNRLKKLWKNKMPMKLKCSFGWLPKICFRPGRLWKKIKMEGRGSGVCHFLLCAKLF